MRASVSAVGLLPVGVWHGPAWAQGSIEERLQKTEQRIRYLEERLAAQDRTIVEKDKQISKLNGLGLSLEIANPTAANLAAAREAWTASRVFEQRHRVPTVPGGKAPRARPSKGASRNADPAQYRSQAARRVAR